MPLSGVFFVSLHHQSNRMTMFKKTDPNPQLDIFTAPSMQLGSRASKKYSDPNAWHNQFYSLVTTKIDEEIFKPLFPEGKKSGRPNASIRILVAMSVLKEGFGCSDEDLFEKCEFDLLTRKALGMELLTDVTPSIDTYYLFRRRICEYQERTGIDLMQLCFEQLAGNQVRLLKISGKCVRMDSKLIGSNIARQSRYELIHTTLVKFLKTGKMQGGCRWELIPHDEDGNIPDFNISKIDICPFRAYQRSFRLFHGNFSKDIHLRSRLLCFTQNDHTGQTGFKICPFLKWAHEFNLVQS